MMPECKECRTTGMDRAAAGVRDRKAFDDLENRISSAVKDMIPGMDVEMTRHREHVDTTDITLSHKEYVYARISHHIPRALGRLSDRLFDDIMKKLKKAASDAEARAYLAAPE